LKNQSGYIALIKGLEWARSKQPPLPSPFCSTFSLWHIYLIIKLLDKKNVPSLTKLDLFTGLGGFVVACNEVGIETIFTSEIDTYNVKLINQKLGLENGGLSEWISDFSTEKVPRSIKNRTKRINVKKASYFVVFK